MLFAILATGWAKLMKEWALVEISLKYYPTVYNLQKRIYLLIAVLLLTGASKFLKIDARS